MQCAKLMPSQGREATIVLFAKVDANGENKGKWHQTLSLQGLQLWLLRDL
jgi:hypothetical protein